MSLNGKKIWASTAKPSYTCVQANSGHNTALEKIHVQAKRKEPAICPNLQNINLPSLLIRWVNEIQFDIPSPTRDWSGVFINLKML